MCPKIFFLFPFGAAEALMFPKVVHVRLHILLLDAFFSLPELGLAHVSLPPLMTINFPSHKVLSVLGQEL